MKPLALYATLALTLASAANAKEANESAGTRSGNIHQISTYVEVDNVRITPIRRAVPTGKTGFFKVRNLTDAHSVTGCNGTLNDDRYLVAPDEDCTVEVLYAPNDEAIPPIVSTVPGAQFEVLSGYSRHIRAHCPLDTQVGWGFWSDHEITQTSGLPIAAWSYANGHFWNVWLPTAEREDSFITLECSAVVNGERIYGEHPITIHLLPNPEVIVESTVDHNQPERPVMYGSIQEKRMYFAQGSSDSQSNDVGLLEPSPYNDHTWVERDYPVLTSHELPYWAGGQAHPVQVLKERGQYRMWLQGHNAFGTAVSQNGEYWTVDASPVAEGLNLLSVTDFQGKRYSYYKDSTELNVSISDDGRSLGNSQTINLIDEVVLPGTSYWMSSPRDVAMTRVVHDGDDYILAIAGMEDSAWAFQHILYLSTDGKTFHPRSILRTISGQYESRVSVQNITVREDGKIRLCGRHEYNGYRVVCSVRQLNDPIFDMDNTVWYKPSIRSTHNWDPVVDQ